jgi:hypothetical protein
MSFIRFCTIAFILGTFVEACPAQSLNDVLVICPTEFQPALRPWIDYRTKQGHFVRVVHPAPTPAGIKQQIRKSAAMGPLKFVFLIGDAGNGHTHASSTVPVDYVAAKVNVLFGSEPEIATDNTFADLDGDGLPELAIGRLPADSRAEVARFVARVIEYEQDNSPNQKWRRNVNFVAGVGGFGSVIDNVIEQTTKQIITDLVPCDCKTSMTFGCWRSPYCPDPRRFSETAIRRFNEGCLFWVYIGHGSEQCLDSVCLPDQTHPILSTDNVTCVHCNNGSPIAIFLACYTGAADHELDCLAETMIRQPRGPIAAICGSRMTMPYAMSLLSLEMLNEFFDGRTETLGELMKVSKQRMVAGDGSPSPYRDMIQAMGMLLSPQPKLLRQECLEHVQLIHLFGDPLLRIKRPEKIELQADDVVESGDVLHVTGVSPAAGEMTVELVYRRNRFRQRPPYRREYDSSDKAFCAYQDVYENSHQLTCDCKTIVVNKGPFDVELQVPETAGGSCAIRCMLNSQKTFGLGARPIEVRKKVRDSEARNNASE